MFRKKRKRPPAAYMLEDSGEFVWDAFYQFECNWGMFVALDFATLPFGVPMPIDPKLLPGVDGTSVENYLVPLDAEFPEAMYLQAIAYMTKKDLDCDVVNGDAMITEQRWISTCSHNPGHRSQMVIEQVTVELAGRTLRPLVPSTDDEVIIFSEEAMQRVKSSGLLGPRFGRVILVNPRYPVVRDNPRFYFLKCDSAPPLRISRVVPESRNCCHRCGAGPLICHACGAKLGFTSCPQCDADTFAFADEYKGPGDPRICVHPYPAEGPVVEVSQWNGEDFFGSGTAVYVTYRAIEFLVREGIGPFTAKPIRADIQGASDEKMAMLERARGGS